MQNPPEFSIASKTFSGKALLILSLWLAGALVTPSPLRAATITYTGLAAGNFSRDWNNRTNWSSAAVPTAADDVTINSGVVILPPTAAFASLTVAGATVKGEFTNRGTIKWTSGTIGGQVTIAAGGVLELIGPDQKNLEECAIDNAGTIRWGGAGGLQSSTTVVINNQAGGVFEALNDASLQHFSQSVPAVFNNAGVFRKSVGTNVTLIQNVAFNNSGKVEIQSGTLSFPNGFANRGTFDVAAGAKLDLAGGKVALQTGSTISGDGFYGVTGKVDVDGGINSPNFQLTGTLDGSNSLTGRRVWTTGTIKSKLTIAAGGVLE
ncbi:MAG: hypothetical protein HY735_21250, partial [Verrucomicrobia bacterium]|nr:hypothetical protein [Verrucomicrobiota bacterium]